MSKYSLKGSVVVLGLALFLGFAGCSSDNGSAPVVLDDGGAGAGDTTTSYTGTKSLSGSFETFASTSQAPALSPSRAVGNASEIVKLYVLDENGNMKDTNITCPVSGSEYTCTNIAGNKEYIIRYIKDLGNGQVLEMKSNAQVGDADVSGVEVSRITSLIVEAISKAVEEAVVGIVADESKVADLIASVKKAIKTSIASLVSQGLISIPSEADMTTTLTTGETFDTFAGVAKDNSALSQASGVILSDESVSNTLGASKNDAQLAGYASMTTRDLVNEIFIQTFGDDGGVPDWVVDFLSDNYNGGNYTVGSFIGKLEFTSRAIDDSNNWDSNSYINTELNAVGITSGQEAFVRDLLSEINTTLASSGFTDLKAELVAHYALKAKTDKTDADFKALAEFPPIIEYLYPETFVNSMTSSTPLQNVGQGIVIISFMENVLVKDILKTKLEAAGGTYFEGQLDNLYIVETDPQFIFQDLGLASQITTYDKLSINYFEARTDSSFDPNTGSQTEFLTVYLNVEKPSWMIGGSVDISKFTSATLTYPTASGTSSVDLDVSLDGSEVRISYTPWDNTAGTPDATKMDITNNISGDYVVSITYDGETATKTFNTFILKGANNVRATLVSPTEMPQWPEELNDPSLNWSNLTAAQQTLSDDFNTAIQNYQITTFAVNNTGNDAVENVVFNWDDSALNAKLSTLNIPENIKVAYQVNINLHDNGCDTGNNWEECNTEIYNTWWNNKPVTTTSFKLPIPLRETGINEKYNIGLSVVFIDKDTGRMVANGGHTWAEFTVGTAAVLNGDEKINFSGKVNLESGSTLPTNFKVALISDVCTFNESDFTQTCAKTIISSAGVSGDTYSLDANISDIKTAMNTNGAYISIVAFEDKNNDGTFTDWDPAPGADNTAAEQIWWPNNSSVWFENWGDFRVGSTIYNEQNGETENEVHQIVPNEDVNITNIDFNIYN